MNATYNGTDLPVKADGCSFDCPFLVGGDHTPECEPEFEAAVSSVDPALVEAELRALWGDR